MPSVDSVRLVYAFQTLRWTETGFPGAYALQISDVHTLAHWNSRYSRILITHDKHVLCPGPTGTGKSPLVLLLVALRQETPIHGLVLRHIYIYIILYYIYVYIYRNIYYYIYIYVVNIVLLEKHETLASSCCVACQVWTSQCGCKSRHLNISKAWQDGICVLRFLQQLLSGVYCDAILCWNIMQCSFDLLAVPIFSLALVETLH